MITSASRFEAAVPARGTGYAGPGMMRAKQNLVFDLTGRTKLRVTGADRLRYLNGQISNDLRKATETKAIQACVLSAKGKIDAEIFITVEGEAFLLETEATAEALSARLERYIIADAVELEDVTDAWALFHVLGAEAPALGLEKKARSVTRFGEDGVDLWLARAVYEQARQKLAEVFSIATEADAEAWRIGRGLPRWGRELTDQIIPTEANLEASAIDYAKGCYIGQEVISRIKMSGQTNKRLCGFVTVDAGAAEPGMRLFTTDEAGKEVGWLTSVNRSGLRGQEIALGFVKRGFQTVGTRLQARAETGAEEALVEIAALPFV